MALKLAHCLVSHPKVLQRLLRLQRRCMPTLSADYQFSQSSPMRLQQGFQRLLPLAEPCLPFAMLRSSTFSFV